jgi:peroxisomal trans-2-enoyl-CoA reductase
VVVVVDRGGVVAWRVRGRGIIAAWKADSPLRAPGGVCSRSGAPRAPLARESFFILLEMAAFFRPGLFRGQSAIVTGGGTGIGKAIAAQLASLECNVVIAGRKEERLTSALAELRAAAPEASVQHRVCNIRDEEQVRGLMEFTKSTFGSLDLLINNAGGQFPSPASKINAKGWHAVIDTNLTGTFTCCREAYEAGLRGSVVNIIADMFKGFPMMAHTGAARAAVDNLTKSLALEWAHDGVRVNAVAPGIIFSETAAKNYDEDGAFMRGMASEVPAGRLGTPDEVASAVTFLLSPAARYISGATLRVDAASSLYKQAGFRVPPTDKWPPHEA